MHKRFRQVPDEDLSSSSSGTEKTPTRYKPLAPKELPGPISAQEQIHPPEMESPALELTFVNVTDPRQSRTQEARKFVRTQVMKNFAKEKRRKPSHAENVSREQFLTTTRQLLSSATTSAPVDPVMDRSKTNLSVLHAQGTPESLGAPLPIRRSNSLSTQNNLTGTPDLPFSTSGWNVPAWPVDSDPLTNQLVNHCFSPSFRATNPLYMISLLVRRPTAETYPLSVDIDSDVQEVEVADHSLNEILHLAESSAALAHALLMVSASHLALRQINKVVNDHQVIHHKTKALYLLNESIKDFHTSRSLHILATIAVLASHELVVRDYQAWTVHIMGFSRILDLSGGVMSPSGGLVHRLIQWSDQFGALWMNTRPFFPAEFVVTPRLIRHALPQSFRQPYDEVFISGNTFLTMVREKRISRILVDILEDISLIAIAGLEKISRVIQPPTAENLVRIRDNFLQRLIYLAPDVQENEDNFSCDECVRLAAMLIILDRLFLPLLPSAYFQITHLIGDRLATAVSHKAVADSSSGVGWSAMWVCFVGTTVSSNNPRTRENFIHSAAQLSQNLCTGSDSMASEIEEGVGQMVGTFDLFAEQEMGVFVRNLRAECERLAT